MTNEELQRQKAIILKNLEKVENEAGRLAETCRLARMDLITVRTGEDAREWQKKYNGIEEEVERILLW